MIIKDYRKKQYDWSSVPCLILHMLKKKLLRLTFFIVIGLIFGGCTINRRYHNSGFNTNWSFHWDKSQTVNEKERVGDKSTKNHSKLTIASNSIKTIPQKQSNLETDTTTPKSDSLITLAKPVKKDSIPPAVKTATRKIHITNALMVADILSVQQVIQHYRYSDAYGPIIYVLLIAPAIMIVLLLRRINLASKRNRLMLGANINSKEAIYKVLNAQRTSIMGLIFSPIVFLTPILLPLTLYYFNKAERAEPNNQYIKKIRTRNGWVRFLSLAISLSTFLFLSLL